MRVRVDVHHHLVIENARLDVILEKLIGLESRLTAVQVQGAHMAGELERLEASVAPLQSGVDSAVALLEHLSQLLRDAIASGNPGRIAAVADLIDQNKDRLAAAVVANTPAA